ncbi:MAG: endolytic transglycosylase MltG [Rikenellaceae bacterium]
MRRIFILIAVGALLGAVALLIAWQQFYGNAVVRDEVIYLSSSDLEGDEYEQTIERTVLQNIKHRAAFNFYAERLNLPARIRSGRYELREGMSVVGLVRMLKLGIQSPVEVTFNNVRLAENLAGRIAQQIEADSVALLNVLHSNELAKGLGLKSSAELVSLFIPNTYEIWWNITPEELIKRMKRESDIFWSGARDERRKELKLSRVEVITLASIVHEECSTADELQRVAGVYVNRLQRGMKLQADPTVKFAVGDFSLKRILNKHLAYDSPYNTYIYKGLPPSPIAIPSIAAVDAVLNYERHNYIYFCAREQLDGRHNFTSSYSQHLRNAQRYSEALNKLRIR